MKKVRIIIFLILGTWSILGQEMLTPQDSLLFAESKTFTREQLDSIQLEKAILILKSYKANDSLKKALRLLQESIMQDRTGEALEVLEKRSMSGISDTVSEKEVENLLVDFQEDDSYLWYRELARDSMLVSIYDVQGREVQIWTNTPKMQSYRYWLHKTPEDSLGFWLHSLPTKGVLLVPDYDIYQEKGIAEYRSSLFVPIPIRENPGMFSLISFMKYPRFLFPWDVGLTTNIGFSQSYYENWVKGGENNIAANLDVLFQANYNRKNISWENYIRWKYGLIKSGNRDNFIRNTDQMELNSKYGLKASKRWYYSAQLNAKTQLFDGYNYSENERTRVTDFLSPGYLSLALGMDYKPSRKFSLLLSPATGRLIYMRDIQGLDETTYGIKKGKHLWQQLGPYVRMKWKQNLVKSVSFDTSLELFSNYAQNFGNIDIDWNTTIDMRINYFMSARVSLQTLYDDDVEIPIYKIVEGKKKQIGVGNRLQFNENLSLGLVFRL